MGMGSSPKLAPPQIDRSNRVSEDLYYINWEIEMKLKFVTKEDVTRADLYGLTPSVSWPNPVVIPAGTTLEASDEIASTSKQTWYDCVLPQESAEIIGSGTMYVPESKLTHVHDAEMCEVVVFLVAELDRDSGERLMMPGESIMRYSVAWNRLMISLSKWHSIDAWKMNTVEMYDLRENYDSHGWSIKREQSKV
jgi:hypothetical protein